MVKVFFFLQNKKKTTAVLLFSTCIQTCEKNVQSVFIFFDSHHHNRHVAPFLKKTTFFAASFIMNLLESKVSDGLEIN